MKKYTYAYGRKTMDFEVDESKVLQEIRTKEFPVVQDVKQAVLDAINNPIGGKSLAERVKPGDTAEIPVEHFHTLKAVTDLTFIEVQQGDPLVEEDIERFEWKWE